MGKTSDMYHFVFVHGACHGAWCWYKLRTLLEAAGHDVDCVDLEGAGINQTDPNTVFTMEHYNQPLFHFMSALPHHHKVIVVAHSAGGSSLTDVMCMFPTKVAMAVFVAAGMENPKTSSKEEEDSNEEGVFDYIYGLGVDQDPTGVIMKKQYQRDRYYNRSPLEDSTLASMLLRPAPYRALRRPMIWPQVPREIYDVPRVYVKTMQDHMFDPRRQDAMVSMWPPRQVVCLESDHSAFFSNPRGLLDCLLRAAALYLDEMK